MCTVTIVPQFASGDEVSDRRVAGLRVVHNRDESRSRPQGRPPRIYEGSRHRALMPIDPPSGGTWVAANDAGMILTILNVNPQVTAKRAYDQSRGTIIPQLIDTDTATAASQLIGEIDTSPLAPFRLVITDVHVVIDHHFNGDAMAVRQYDLTSGPVMFTSSGLGDRLVEPPRRALFDRMFAGAPHNWLDRQKAFHRHVWPDRTHLSVCMSRDEARTVSMTMIDVDDDAVAMTYYPDAPDRDPATTVQRLEMNRTDP